MLCARACKTPYIVVGVAPGVDHRRIDTLTDTLTVKNEATNSRQGGRFELGYPSPGTLKPNRRGSIISRPSLKTGTGVGYHAGHVQVFTSL
jgi:hypothetical protein